MDKVTQRFCSACGGLKVLRINGKIVPPSQWMAHGMASDIGCICP